MRRQYTRQELESITQETAIYIEGGRHSSAPMGRVGDCRGVQGWIPVLQAYQTV